MGLRKAWYIESAVETQDFASLRAIVVFKNNNEDKAFTVVPLDRVRLDLSFKNEESPVIDGVRTINLKLKNTK
jgi:uncharacterized protein YifN (PemK superfamily)